MPSHDLTTCAIRLAISEMADWRQSPCDRLPVMVKFESFQPSSSYALGFMASPLQSEAPSRSQTPSHISSTISSRSSIPYFFQSAPKVDSTILSNTHHGGLDHEFNPLIANLHQPILTRPTSPMCPQQQRSLKKQKRTHSTDFETRSQSQSPAHVIQGLRGELALDLNLQPDHAALWDDCEQSLDELRGEMVQGGKPLLTRRLGFLR